MSALRVEEATERSPRFIDGQVEVIADLRLRRRFYLYSTPQGLVSGTTFNVRFTVDAESRDVWPVFKDLNLWQSSHHRYSGVVGDLGGKSFKISSQPKPDVWLSSYDVVRVVPEHLMVFSQPVLADDAIALDLRRYYGGGVSPGFHVFQLSARDGKTDVNILMQHARRDPDRTEEEALSPWRDQVAPSSQLKWRDSFVPTLKRLVAERRERSTAAMALRDATETAPRFINGPVEDIGDLRLVRRFYMYPTPAGLVAGTTFNVRCTIDRPPRDVWPVFKDLNLWQSTHHRYSGVVGDLEGGSFRISGRPDLDKWLGTYDVVRVIPEHLMVFSQPIVPEDQIAAEQRARHGGGISPGFHVFRLSERDGTTDVDILMQHAKRDPDWTEEQAIVPWRDQLAPSSQEKWRDSFIPTLKKLIHQRS